MIKIFDRDDKINFVDENNVLVGYNDSQQCCEHADWFIADRLLNLTQEDTVPESELEDFVFDIEFTEPSDYDLMDGENETSFVVFRLVNPKTNDEKFLHLFNTHNGYYAHGFIVKHGDEIIQNDTL